MLYKLYTDAAALLQQYKLQLIIPNKLFCASVAFICLTSFACTKNDAISGTASLTMFNAIIGCDRVYTDFGSVQPVQGFTNRRVLDYGQLNSYNGSSTSNLQFNSYSGMQQIVLYKHPDTTSKDAPVIDINISIPAGSINSLFFLGTESVIDTLFIQDMLPLHVEKDSTMGIRFINLTEGNLTVAINQLGHEIGSEVSALSHKQYSTYKKYKVAKEGNSFVLEIRDVSTGALLINYPIDLNDQYTGSSMYRNRNFTLAILGIPDQTNQYKLKAVLINNY